MILTASSQAASPTTELACGTLEAAAACVDVLREVVAGLDPDALLATEAPDVWAVFDQGEKLCTAAKILVTRRVEESSAWKDAGMRSVAEYLALRGGTTRDVARDALKTSERLRDLPHVEDALRHGELSAAQVHPIADAAAHDPNAESELVGHAKVASLKELKDTCLRIKVTADPKPQDTRDRIFTNRHLRFSTDSEGAWRLYGRGPLDHAGMFSATLNPLIDDLFKRSRNDGSREDRDALAYDALQEMARLARAAYYGHDLPDDTEDCESAGHDDHVNSRHEAGAGDHATEPEDDPGSGLPKAATPESTTGAGFADQQTNPRGPQHTSSRRAGNSGGGEPDPDARQRIPGNPRLAHGSSSVTGEQRPLPGDHNPGTKTEAPPNARRTGRKTKTKRKRKNQPNPSHLAILRLDIEALRRGYVQGDELCEIAGVGPVPVEAARGLLGDAILNLVITKGTAVASVVHLGRGPTVAQRTALLWSQPECSAEGCPHTFTQTDHRHDWHKARVTELHNLDRLCNHHHALKTHDNWALVAGTGKRPMVPPHDPRHPDQSRSDARTPNPPSTARNGNQQAPPRQQVRDE